MAVTKEEIVSNALYYGSLDASKKVAEVVGHYPAKMHAINAEIEATKELIDNKIEIGKTIEYRC